MPPFLIFYGRPQETDVIDASSLLEAEIEAARRSMADGILDDDLPDTTWAEPLVDT